jgi:hypothetical protein
MKKLITMLLILWLALPALAIADNVNTNIIGRWTIESSYSELEFGYMFGKTDLIFFNDGNVYRFTVTKKNHANDISIDHDSGIWIGENNNYVIRFNNKTFKAHIDEQGFLFLENEDITNMFIRVQYIKEDI